MRKISCTLRLSEHSKVSLLISIYESSSSFKFEFTMDGFLMWFAAACNQASACIMDVDFTPGLVARDQLAYLERCRLNVKI